MCVVGTFAEHTVVNVASCVKITPDIPLDKAALVGCGVPTGWGSSVYVGKVTSGDSVVILGMGGVGCGAVQARHCPVHDTSWLSIRHRSSVRRRSDSALHTPPRRSTKPGLSFRN